MFAKPQKEHEWLQQLVGDWTYEHESSMGPGEPVQKFTGRETVRSLGGLWVIGESEGNMPGGGIMNAIITIGFDSQKGHYVGSWIGSVMNFMWIYEGVVDPDGKTIRLNTTGPNFADGGKTMAKFQEVITIINSDHRTFTSRMQSPDGSWHEFMTAHYRRKK